MKLDEMDLLVRVAQTGSMTVAARQLNITPAAVSAAVRRAEAHLGIRIFERTTRSLHPTDEGLVLLDGCQDLLRRWERTIEEVRGDSTELSGTVHISAPADTSRQVIAPAGSALCRLHPELRLVLHSSDALSQLHRDAIDIAIRYGALHDSSLTARRLAIAPSVLVAAPDYLHTVDVPQTPQDLTAHRCITLQLSAGPVQAWDLFGDETSETVSLKSPLCGDGLLARQWALEGFGIARKSLFDAIDDLETGRLVRVLPDYHCGEVPIHVVFPSRKFIPARVRGVDAELGRRFAERAGRCRAWLDANAGAGT